ncbi:MAG: hypothetical protein A3E01_05425 [Gammaproteobacteria bacterium RIFCSPHIGHO2_12_FULL_63_22]|nr:MAG: hypothetical protein A3E01_05425 [Gammaproteobacteria bacterium RIFCSPHIGHO2_12_FULL_63_22]
MQAAQVARTEEAEQAGDFELPPEQWRAWEVFTACERNWRVLIGIGLVHYDGIDNTAMQSAMHMLGVKRKHQRNVFWMVRVLEGEARKFLNQR